MKVYISSLFLLFFFLVFDNVYSNAYNCMAAPAPDITSAAYNVSAGELIVSGSNFVVNSGELFDIDASKITIRGSGGGTFTLDNSYNVKISDPSSFKIVLTDMALSQVNALLNRNGGKAWDNSLYQIDLASGWDVGAIPDCPAYSGKPITVTGILSPSLHNAVYNSSSGVLTLNGTNFQSVPGDDINVIGITLNDGTQFYPLSSSTPNVEIANSNTAIITLSAIDRAKLNSILNNDGDYSASGATYKIQVESGWNGLSEADLLGKQLSVTNYNLPYINAVTYNATTDVLTFSGGNLASFLNSLNDVNASAITVSGGNSQSYTLAGTYTVKILNTSTFSISLNGADITNINSLLNRNGNTSFQGVSYNIQLGSNWNSPVYWADLSSSVTNVTVEGVLSPEIESAIYDFSTGILNITGKNLVELNGNDVDVTKIALSNGTHTYALTSASPDVNIVNPTSVFVTVNGIDRARIAYIFNNNGSSAINGGAYNIAVDSGWNGLGEPDLTGNPVQVNNFNVPVISSVSYNAATGTFTFTGANFVSTAAANDDVDPSKFIVSRGSVSYTISSGAIKTDVESSSSFTLKLSGTDLQNVDSVLNWNGVKSYDNTVYNLACLDNWNAVADASFNLSNLTNAITVSGVSNYPPVASNVALSGNNINSSVLTFSYSYSDLENDTQGSSVIRWYSYSDVIRSDKTLISGVEGTTYTLRTQDIGRYINVEITPVALSGTINGATVGSNLIGPVQNAVPVAEAPAITGSRYLNQTIEGTYVYSDLENDPEGASVYKWYRSDSPEGPDTWIAGANQKTYTITSSDLDKYISFEVMPVSTSQNNNTGATVRSARYQVLNAAPAATLVSINGSFKVGQVLQGVYTYIDLEGDPESSSAFYWYRANASDGSGKILISSNTKNYVIQQADLGKYFSFEVMPAATKGTSTGVPSASVFQGPVGNSVPYATNVRITGTQAVCKTLHGDYDYNDVDGDPEGSSVYQWYISESISGAKTPINGATEKDYTLTVNEQGKYIYFEVIPRAVSGSTTGTGTYSSATGTIINLLPTVTFSGTASICDGTSTKLTLSFTGTPPWNLTYTDGTSQYQLVSSDYVYMLNVNKGGTYKGVSLVDNIDCPVDNLTSFATVSILPLPPVNIEGLNSAYNLRGNPVALTGNPSGGTFSGPGVISSTNMFYPSIAGTVNSPHTIIYEYRSSKTGCTNRDTSIVEVIDADASISGIRSTAKYCNFDGPFTITGTNYVGVVGTFSITGGIGLTDNLNNTASLNPGLLNAGSYTISYTYMDGIPLTIYKDIVVEVLDGARIFGLSNSRYCQDISPVEISGNYSDGVFSGNSVYKNLQTNKYYFNPSLVNPGSTTVTYTYTTSYGCVLSKSVDELILSVPVADFSVKNKCYNGDSTAFKNLTTYNDPITSWAWRFGDVQSAEIDNRSSLFEPKHKYPSMGNRTIRLIAENSLGCRDTVEKVIYLGDIPKANFRSSSDCFKEGEPISFISTSLGLDQIASYSWSIEDTSRLSFTYKNKEILHTFPVIRNYKVKLKVTSENSCTDSLTKTISLRPIHSLKDSSYYNNFEKGKGFWFSNDSVSLNNWYWGTPGGTRIKTAYTGTKAFYTGFKETRKNQQLIITSPCFDFSGTHRPYIALQTFLDAGSNQEGAVLQYTTDNGIAWQNVGEYDKGVKWFNSYSIQSQPGGQQTGWTGVTSQYVNSKYNLDLLANEPRVQFRMVFGESSKASGTDGFAFDDVVINSRDKNVLIEHFTNNSQGASLKANSIVNNVVKQLKDDAIAIQYHTSFPGIDTFNIHNSSDPGARVLYYGMGYPPMSFLQGGFLSEYIYNYTPDSVNATDVDALALSPALFSLKLNISKSSSKVSGTVDIKAVNKVLSRNISLHIIVVENIISQVDGNSVVYNNVVKKMLPSAGGTPLNRSWEKGDFESVNFSWDFKNVYNPENVRLVAFLQDETSHEVCQTIIDDNSIIDGIISNPVVSESWKTIVFPNPANDWVNIDFPETRNNDYKLQIISMNGRLLFEDKIQKGVSEYQFNTVNLDNGVYLVRILGKAKVMSTNKLIIIK